MHTALATLVSVLLVTGGLRQGFAAETKAAVTPTTTSQATRGLTHTVSGEPLGEGRMNVSLLGSWYRQEQSRHGVPPSGSHIMTGTAAFAFGINSHIDMFAVLPAFVLMRPEPHTNTFGVGGFTTGLRGSLPLPSTSPLYLGGQVSVIAGTAGNQINHNREDGYNYFETRTGYDLSGRIAQTLRIGSDTLGLKIHLNQGGRASLQDGHETLLLLGGGVQGIVHHLLVLGVEATSRTHFRQLALTTDPVWITPSVQLRSPYYFNFVLGGDISLSRDRGSRQQRALEPYRLFGGFVFTMDTQQRRREREAQERAALEQERAEMERKAQEAAALADSLARKATEDSVALVGQREVERQRADSLARKAVEDSVALARVQEQLKEEKERRSDAEKQLLSTGLLLLDAVYFSTGRSDISINSRPYLNIIGKMLLKYPKLKIEVAGHTDNTGGLQANMNLSQARAESVRHYLISVAPELGNMLTARGYGPTQPKGDNRTAEGRMMNRRVELLVLNRDVLKEYNR